MIASGRALWHLVRKARFVVVGAVVAGVFAQALLGQLRFAGTELAFNDDARQQIYPFFRYVTAPTMDADLAADYQLDLIPPGYRILFQWSAPWVDPVLVSKVLPYVLLAVLLWASTYSAFKLGGPWVAIFSLILMLQSSAFLDRMIGGLPRAFAFPLVAAGLAAAVAGRTWLLAVSSVAAAWTYPTAAVLLGLVLTFVLLLPSTDRGDAATWSLARRLVVLGIVTVASLLPATVVSRDMARWGRRLGPGDAIQYPEIGPNGRYDRADMIPLDRNPFPDVITEVERHWLRALRSDATWSPELRALNGGTPWLIRCLGIVNVLGVVVLAASGSMGRRAAVLPVSALLAFGLATVCAPLLHLPQRFLAYSVPIIAVVMLPASVAALGNAIARHPLGRPRLRSLFLIAAAAPAILVEGGPGSPRAGYTRVVTSSLGTLRYLGGLPQSSLVAGWPLGVLDDVPYLVRRRVYVNWENHQVFNEGYTLEMRDRMRVVIAALFGSDPSRLRVLRDSAGVTHLVVDVTHFREPPEYFAPFGDEVSAAWRRGSSSGFALQRALTTASVYAEGDLVVLDLSLLP